MQFRSRSATFFLTSIILSLGIASPALGDGLIDNVNGITLKRDGSLVQFNGLLIDDRGRVLRLLNRKDKRPDKLSFKFDALGKTLVPGLVDAHVHLMPLGFSKLTLDLSSAASLAEAQTKIRAFVAANPGRHWILGRGWDAERWGLGRPLTAADLDAAVADMPAWILDRDGQIGWANSAAMTAAGVTPGVKSPPGGRIEMAGGKPSGIFAGSALNLISKSAPAPLPKDNDLALEEAQRILLPLGITSVTDIGTSIADWQAYRRAADRGALRVRIIAYAGGIDNMLLIAGSAPTPWLYEDRLKAVGMVLPSDGTFVARGAYLRQDYADAPGQRGYLMLYDAALRNQMARAAMDGFQVMLGPRGDGANLEALNAITEVAETYKGDRRWRLEHAEAPDAADLSRFSANGIVVSVQPANQIRQWKTLSARLGETRAASALPWGRLNAGRVPIAFGSDMPAGPRSPFAGIAAAMTREDADGQPFGGWHPADRLTFNDALKAYTLGAAYAAFAEDRLGTLEPGAQADFLILDRDISLSRPADIAQTQVLETWIGGKRVYVKKD